MLLVLAGLALSFVPFLPVIRLDPNLVLFFFLPPLLYPAALFTSWRDFRRNLRSILWLAIGLVLVTMTVVAWVAHSFIAGLPWAAAFALGAIVSPPDAIAANDRETPRCPGAHRGRFWRREPGERRDRARRLAICGRGDSHRKFFVRRRPALRFIFVGVGGIAFGLLVGFVMRWVQRHLDDPPVQITVSLLTPFAAYLLAEQLRMSPAFSPSVAAGVYLGWHSTAVDRALPTPAATFLGDGRLPPQRIHLHDDRAAIAWNSAQAEPRTISRLTTYGISRQRHRRFRANRLGFSGDLFAALVQPENACEHPIPPWQTAFSSPGRECAASSRSPPPLLFRSCLETASHFPVAVTYCFSPSASSSRHSFFRA